MGILAVFLSLCVDVVGHIGCHFVWYGFLVIILGEQDMFHSQ